MNPIRWLLPVCLVFLAGAPARLLAQKDRGPALTEKQIEEIREAGVDPDQRLHLYVKFAAEKVDAIHSLAARGRSAPRTERMDAGLQDLASMFDELGSNLDQYGGRKADMRKALKELNTAAPDWASVLNSIPSEPGFELSLRDARESLKDIAEESKQIEQEQIAWFATHKDERGQQREEPK